MYISYLLFFFRASLVAQMVKNLPAMQETQVRSLGREDPLEKEMATHFSNLAWRILWTEESGGLQSIGSQRVRQDWDTNTHTHTQFFLKLFYSFNSTYHYHNQEKHIKMVMEPLSIELWLSNITPKKNDWSMYWFLRAVITNYYRLGSLKQQKCITSQFWRLEVWKQGVGRFGSSWRLWGRICFIQLSFWWLLAIPGILWLVRHITPSSHGFSLGICVRISPFL